MRIVFWISDKTRSLALARAVATGAERYGDHVDIKNRHDYVEDNGYDACAFIGVHRGNRRLYLSHRQTGQRYIFFDKGYMGRQEYMRVSVNSWQPLHYFQETARPPDRFHRLRTRFMAGRQGTLPEKAIIFAGSSQKYCDFHDLGDVTDYASGVIGKLRGLTERPIVYRPKPGWAANHPEEVKEIPGTRLSVGRSISGELSSCHLLITHGSNAAFDALLAGVPVAMLGEGICKPVAMGADWAKIEQPYWPSDDQRYQFFCDAAYCQWKHSEYQSGAAWKYIRPYLDTEVKLAVG